MLWYKSLITLVTLRRLQLSFHCRKWHRCVGDYIRKKSSGARDTCCLFNSPLLGSIATSSSIEILSILITHVWISNIQLMAHIWWENPAFPNISHQTSLLLHNLAGTLFCKTRSTEFPFSSISCHYLWLFTSKQTHFHLYCTVVCGGEKRVRHLLRNFLSKGLNCGNWPPNKEKK